MAGEAFRGANDSTANDTVAQIQGIDVRRRDIAVAQVLNTYSNGLSPTALPTTPKEIVTWKVRSLALGAEALRQGLSPSAAELDAYIGEVRAMFHKSELGALQLAAYLSGYGMTEDEYFNAPEVRVAYERQAAVTKLRTVVVGSLPAEAQADLWTAFGDSLAQAAQVIILDPSYR